MTDEPISPDELSDAALDALTMAQAVNGAPGVTVISRTGQHIPTLASLGTLTGYVDYATFAALSASFTTFSSEFGKIVPDLSAMTAANQRIAIQAVVATLGTNDVLRFTPGVTYTFDNAPGQPYGILLPSGGHLRIEASGAQFDYQGIPTGAGKGTCAFAYIGGSGGTANLFSFTWIGGDAFPTNIGLDPTSGLPASDFIWINPNGAKVCFDGFHVGCDLKTTSKKHRHGIVNCDYNGGTLHGRSIVLLNSEVYGCYDTGIVWGHADSFVMQGGGSKYNGGYFNISNVFTPYSATFGGSGIELGQAGDRSFNGHTLTGFCNNAVINANFESNAGSGVKCVQSAGGRIHGDYEANAVGRVGLDAAVDATGAGTINGGTANACRGVVIDGITSSNSSSVAAAVNIMANQYTTLENNVHGGFSALEIGVLYIDDVVPLRASNEVFQGVVMTKFAAQGAGLTNSLRGGIITSEPSTITFTQLAIASGPALVPISQLFTFDDKSLIVYEAGCAGAYNSDTPGIGTYYQIVLLYVDGAGVCTNLASLSSNTRRDAGTFANRQVGRFIGAYGQATDGAWAAGRTYALGVFCNKAHAEVLEGFVKFRLCDFAPT